MSYNVHIRCENLWWVKNQTGMDGESRAGKGAHFMGFGIVGSWSTLAHHWHPLWRFREIIENSVCSSHLKFSLTQSMKELTSCDWHLESLSTLYHYLHRHWSCIENTLAHKGVRQWKKGRIKIEVFLFWTFCRQLRGPTAKFTCCRNCMFIM